jgi:large repetitive protein
VLANDSDPDDDPITVTSNTDPANGTLTGVNADGSFSYTPDPGYIGTDTFTYTIEDPSGVTDTATVTVDVTDPDANKAPVANNDNYQTRPGTPLDINAATGLLANDTDPDNDPLTVSAFNYTNSNATLTVDADGAFTYTPNLNFLGTDTFTYTAADGFGGTSQATVTIDVVNNNPVANDDNYDTRPGTPLDIDACHRRARQRHRPRRRHPHRQRIQLPLQRHPHRRSPTEHSPTPPTSASPAPTPSPTPPPTASAEPTKPPSPSTSSTNPPSPTTTTTTPDQAHHSTIDAATGVLANDTDPDGDTLTVIAFNYPSNGTLTVVRRRSIHLHPQPGFTGTDTFTYTAADGFGGTDQATVTIEVRPNEPPELTDDAYVTLQDSTLTVPAPGVLGNDTDPDGDTLTVTASTPACSARSRHSPTEDSRTHPTPVKWERRRSRSRCSTASTP